MTKEIANIEQQLAERAALMKGALKSTGLQRISTTNKVFSVPDRPKTLDTIDVVILGYVESHVNFPGAYIPGGENKPNCSAVSLTHLTDEMGPNQEKWPDRLADKCDDCPNNEFGSADNKKGKACSNSYRVAVLFPDANEVMEIQISAGAMGLWDKNVGELINEHGDILNSVVTLGFTEKQFTQVCIKHAAKTKNPNVAEHFKFIDSAMNYLTK